jgi:hypothetical protein
MDRQQFDKLARAVAEDSLTRRHLVRWLGSGLAVLIARRGVGDAQAGRRDHRRKEPSFCGLGQSLCFVSAPEQCRRVCHRTPHGRVCRKKCRRDSKLICVDTQNDPSHCGACNHSCAFAGPTASCLAGACTPPSSTPDSPPVSLSPPPPPVNTPGCVGYGGSCTQSADCCDGIPCSGLLCRYN